MAGSPSIPYNRSELYKNLTEIQGYLAELRYIDDALAYMDDQEASWWQAHGLVDPGHFYIDVDYGTTFPFSRRYRVPEKFHFIWQDGREADIRKHLDTLREEADQWAADEVSSINTQIEPFTWATASTYDHRTLAPLDRAHEKLEDEISADFGRLSHSLGNWEGEAADNFATYFYNPFEHTLRSQKQLLSALAGGLLTAKAIAESTQHSLMNVIHYAREELRELLELRAIHAEIARQEAVRNILILANGTATILGAVASGGLWVIAMGAVAGSASIASIAVPNSAAEEHQLRGSNAVELANAVTDTIGTIDRHDGDQHDILLTELDGVLARVENLRGGPDEDDGRLIPIRPDIVDGVDGDDFYLP